MTTTIIHPDGGWENDPVPVVVTTKHRVSHIWPSTWTRRTAFRLLRLVFGDEGKVAAWTRSWKCVWTVRLTTAPSDVIFSAITRERCVAWERKYL